MRPLRLSVVGAYELFVSVCGVRAHIWRSRTHAPVLALSIHINVRTFAIHITQSKDVRSSDSLVLAVSRLATCETWAAINWRNKPHAHLEGHHDAVRPLPAQSVVAHFEERLHALALRVQHCGLLLKVHRGE